MKEVKIDPICTFVVVLLLYQHHTGTLPVLCSRRPAQQDARQCAAAGTASKSIRQQLPRVHQAAAHAAAAAGACNPPFVNLADDSLYSCH